MSWLRVLVVLLATAPFAIATYFSYKSRLRESGLQEEDSVDTFTKGIITVAVGMLATIMTSSIR